MKRVNTPTLNIGRVVLKEHLGGHYKISEQFQSGWLCPTYHCTGYFKEPRLRQKCKCGSMIVEIARVYIERYIK